MPSHRILRGLHNAPKEPKPSTPLQHQEVALRKLDQARTEASHSARLRTLNEEQHPDVDNLQQGKHEHAYELQQPPEDADNDARDALGDDDDKEIDMNQFMPHHGPANPHEDQNDPVVIALRKEKHQAARLKHENLWAWQYAIMVPTFLCCLSETLTW
ncbi:uncharacterized protein MELLADRAFT_109711 [Melampsora larici-populina 98AG31]|uniref:Uncharacterized protein n=1 Tax=Melampsora larici-populina (strain 98AG31 / pathotype 3-4-7) TaxID=747676 RepID=F4RXD3_MELLP|nr:uncharacterized protein MELLADRAFT_109711 [Melampsora larici-populina 98AG31]EGG02945.1 hypothetical protein MELLADRAFT_109711 [Melampsora larici-populina 98AG31]